MSVLVRIAQKGGWKNNMTIVSEGWNNSATNTGRQKENTLLQQRDPADDLGPHLSGAKWRPDLQNLKCMFVVLVYMKASGYKSVFLI